MDGHDIGRHSSRLTYPTGTFVTHITMGRDNRRPFQSTSVFASICVGTANSKLCQNCVTYPPKPWGITVIYEDTPKLIDVAGSR